MKDLLGIYAGKRLSLLGQPRPDATANMTTRNYIRYRSDYKYQLAEAYVIDIPILPNTDIKTDFIELDIIGQLTINQLTINDY
jgi:hypothetical protein